LSAAVIGELKRAEGAGRIVVPTWQGKRGHPTLIGWGHVAGIRARPAGEGLNLYLRSQPVVEVAVADSGVLADMDTPEDYARLVREWPAPGARTGHRRHTS
jgi:molybdenum cofactor cytidylyltransferase